MAVCLYLKLTSRVLDDLWSALRRRCLPICLLIESGMCGNALLKFHIC
jgi:hypothetical protein